MKKTMMRQIGVFLLAAVVGINAIAAGKGNSGKAESGKKKTKQKLAPLPLQLPIPVFMGTPPENMALGPHVEPFSDKPRPPFLAPVGVTNVALHKKVTSSDPSPVTGSLEMIVDGNKEAVEEALVELHRRCQWVQIDLGQPCKIYAILIWHDHSTYIVCHDVIVQVADDPDFTKNVRTLFNNDYDNSCGQGIGRDKEYFETYQGKLINAKGVVARYVRCYSNGSTYSSLNRYLEIEVWGQPLKKKK